MKKIKKRAPQWTSAPLKNALNSLEQQEQVIHLSVKGIAMVRAVPQAVKALAAAEGTENTEQHKLDMNKAEAIAELAKNQVMQGFPLLYAHATIGVWSTLDYMIKELISAYCKNKPSVLKVEAISKLKISIGDFVSHRGAEKYFHLSDAIERELGASIKYGAERFEKVLAPFGMSGELPKRLARDIFELAQVRNSLAHTGYRADKKLLRACPWLKIKVGQPLVPAEMFFKYLSAAHSYLTLLICRSGQLHGVDMSKEHQHVFDEYNL